MSGQPDSGTTIFDVKDLGYEEIMPGAALPHNIIPVNTDFVVWADFEIAGWIGHLLHEAAAAAPGDDWRVRYYAEELGGTNDQLLGEKTGAFISSAPPHNYDRSNSEFTVSGGLGAAGTYRLTCTVDCLDPTGLPNGMTGFFEGEVIQIHEV